MEVRSAELEMRSELQMQIRVECNGCLAARPTARSIYAALTVLILTRRVSEEMPQIVEYPRWRFGLGYAP